MKIYNSQTQTTEAFTLRDHEVTVYVCGITPYNTTHLGHAFTYTAYDQLIRYFELKGISVRYAQNVTDVDDDILKKAKETGEDWCELGQRWTEHYMDDMITIGLWPRVRCGSRPMPNPISDLIDLPGFQQVVQAWHSVAGVPTALLDTDCPPFCAVGWRKVSTRFCHLVRPAGRRWPLSDDALFSRLEEGVLATSSCPNGLMTGAMPVMIKGEHVATLFMGRFLHRPPDEAAFRQQPQIQLAEQLASMGREHKLILGASTTFNADLVRAQQHIALMLQTTQRASSALGPDQILEHAAEAMVAAVGVPFCGIYLMDAERGVFVPRVVRGPLTASGLEIWRERSLDPAVDLLAGETLRRQTPTVWCDAETDPRISREMVQAWGIKSVLAVPIRVSDQVLGLALLSTSSDDRHFTSDEIELVWGIANSVALAVDNARLYHAMRQGLAENQGLQRVATALLHNASPEAVLEIVCAEAQHLTGALAGAIWLIEDDTWLRMTYSTGAAAAFFDRIPVAGSLSGLAVRRDAPFLTNAPAGEPYDYVTGKRPTAFLSVPLHANGRVIGVLEVVDKPGGFVKDDVRVVSLFANQAAINIEHARLNQQAAELAVLEERQRLARELHDSVIQSLYSMALYADAAALALAAGKQQVTVGHLQELRDTARHAMYDMRLLIFELHPPALEQEGLVVALRVRLAAVEARAGLQAELEVEGERRLPIGLEQELYRIAQEALNNVIKHAEARQVTVRLQFTDAAVCLEVRDDGAGFDPLTARGAGGVGLRSFEERTAKLGGQITLESQLGQGTTVTVVIPTQGRHELL